MLSLKSISFYAFIMGVFVSCTSTSNEDNVKVLPPADYVNWVKNPSNGLVKSSQVGKVLYELTYTPKEYVVANEIRSNSISSEELDNRVSELGNQQYYNLKIKSLNSSDVMQTNITSRDEYDARINYYSFDFQNDIVLVAGMDTISCNMCHFVRSHGVAPYVDFILSFDEYKESKDNQILLFDRQIAKDVVSFKYQASDFKNLPQIKTI